MAAQEEVGMIGGLKHSFVNMWDLDGTSIVEATSTTAGGRGHVIVPTASILHRSDDLADALRVYVDVALVFAEPE